MGSIDLLPECSTPPARRNWNNIEWDKFRTTLNGNLSTLGPAHPIEDKDTFSTAFNLLTAAIQSTTDQHVPVYTPTLYTKWWWSQDLSRMRKQKCHPKSKSYRL